MVHKVDEKDCIHFWSIETAIGPMSKGTCRYCFATKDFKNSTEVTTLFSHLNRKRDVIEEEGINHTVLEADRNDEVE